MGGKRTKEEKKASLAPTMARRKALLQAGVSQKHILVASGTAAAARGNAGQQAVLKLFFFWCVRVGGGRNLMEVWQVGWIVTVKISRRAQWHPHPPLPVSYCLRLHLIILGRRGLENHYFGPNANRTSIFLAGRCEGNVILR